MAETVPSPLAGKTVVVTRAAAQSGKLLEELTARRAKVKLLPLVSFESFAAVDALYGRWISIGSYQRGRFGSRAAELLAHALPRNRRRLQKGRNIGRHSGGSAGAKEEAATSPVRSAIPI